LIVELVYKYNLHYSTIVIFISIIVIIFVKVYLNQKIFINILWGFVGRIMIILNSGNSFIMIILGWDLLGLTRLLLVLYYNSKEVNTRAFSIMLVNSLSDRIFIVIIMMYVTTNTLQSFRVLILTIIVVSITKSAI